jgi:hypothetical protein
MARERLENKYEQTSVRKSSFRKNEDPYAWITALEESRMKLEDTGSAMTEVQFIIQILNNLTNYRWLYCRKNWNQGKYA